MAEKEYGKYQLVCDECGKVVSDFETFWGALDHAEAEFWSAKMVNGEWENYCLECREKESVE